MKDYRLNDRVNELVEANKDNITARALLKSVAAKSYECKGWIPGSRIIALDCEDEYISIYHWDARFFTTIALIYRNSYGYNRKEANIALPALDKAAKFKGFYGLTAFLDDPDTTADKVRALASEVIETLPL